jgi:hypothetical protein
MVATHRTPAFLLFGDLHKIGPYLTELRARDLAVLVVAGRGGSSQAEQAVAMLGKPDHPFAGITEVSLRDGDDVNGVVDQSLRWARRYDIVGALVTAEVYVEPGALVCDLLGLPGVGLRASRVCRNKFLQRRYLSQWSPRSILATGPADVDGDIAFPVVVKPLTLESSAGVRLVPAPRALAKILTGLTRGTELLVEERVEGREYNVDTIVIDHEPVVTMFTQKGTNEDTTEFFVELAHTTPATNLSRDEADRITKVQAAVIERLDLGTGMAHAEYRLSNDGRVVLMEIAARPPGDGCLPLYRLATGQAVEPVLLDAALGRPAGYTAVPRRRARQIYFDHAPGILSDVRLDWPGQVRPCWVAETTGLWPTVRPADRTAAADLRELLVLKKRNEPLLSITESSTRAVTALFDAPLDADIDAVEARVRKAVTIDIQRTADAAAEPPRTLAGRGGGHLLGAGEAVR